MSKTNKESLEKLLVFISDICEREENKWFKRALIQKLTSDNGFENFPEFVKYQKKQFKLKGNIFYSDITDKKLKKQLADDYIEMCWYQSINRIDRFLLFAFYQMENLLNYYARTTNAHDKIEKNNKKYTHEYAPKFIVTTHTSFFQKGKRNPIEKVNIWAKVTYWMIETGFVIWEKSNHSAISNLINVRNNESHRDSQKNSKYVDSVLLFHKKSDFSALGFYTGVIKKIAETV